MDEDDNLLGREDAAAFLTARGYRTSRRTLEKLACLGGSPIMRTWGRRVLYRKADLIAWAESRLSAPRASTSEARHNAA
jgi:hypothetical protein